MKDLKFDKKYFRGKFIGFLDDIKISKDRKENTVKCKCGHSVFIPAFKDDSLCDWCKCKVINTTKNHFKYKLRKEINKWNMN